MNNQWLEQTVPHHVKLKKGTGIKPKSAIYCFLICFAYLISVFFIANSPVIHGDNLHFAAEYGYIAEALATGKGFSNPFGTDSGETAWTTPLYPILMSGLFKIAGVKSILSAWILLFVKYCALAISGVLLYDIAFRYFEKNTAKLIVPIYLLFLTANYWITFQLLSDIWLLNLIGTLLLHSFCRLQLNSKQPGIFFGVLGGFSALVHPVTGFTFAVLTMSPGNGFSWRNRIIAALVSMIVISPWVARNYISFGHFIPLKSNLMFDAYQGGYVSENGILTSKLFSEFHPFHENETQRFYTSIGEAAFISHYKEQFSQHVNAEPLVYIEKVLFRLLAVSVLPVEFSTDNDSSLLLKVIKSAIYIAPILAMLAWIFVFKPREHQILMLTSITYIGAFLLPFVLVGFYYRYRIPLVPAFSLIILVVGTSVFERLSSHFNYRNQA